MYFSTEDHEYDLQLSLMSVGDSVDKPQSPHDTDKDESKESCETVYLSRTKLQKLSDNLLRNSALKYLYLEGNELHSIPPSLFTSLPNLLWLDLRHNQIQSLPVEIGRHRSLRTLLLEGNPITELPPELGNVLSLTGLNLRDCPIFYPPPDVLQRGVHSILQFLRGALAQRPVSAPKSLPDVTVVERLQLELMGSSLEEEEDVVVEDEDVLKFNDLKNQMSLMEKAELERVTQADRRLKPHPLPTVRRKKAATKALTPQLQLFDTPLWDRPGDRRQAAMKELQEKQALIEQRRKSQEALRRWWSQAKNTQQSGNKQRREVRERRQKEETDTRPRAEDSSHLHQRQAYSIIEYEESSAVRKLRQQIYSVVEKMEERRKNPTGTREEQIEAAERDVKEMRRLQAQLIDVKRGRGFVPYPEHIEK